MSFNLKVEEIKYIKILYTTTEGEVIKSKAAVKKIDAREIVACEKYQENVFVKTPQEIDLSIIYNDGIYKAKGILKTFENSDPYMFFIIETPQNYEREQKREFFRVNSNYACTLKSNNSDKETSYAVSCINISANGIKVLSKAEFTEKKPFILLIQIKDKTIQTEAKIIRSEKIKNNFEISLTFTKISDKDRDYISQTCLQKQLEQKRNSLK